MNQATGQPPPDEAAFKPSRMLAAGLEAVLTRTLQLDPDTLNRAAELNGRVIALELLFGGDRTTGPRLTFYLLPHAGGIQVIDHYPGDPQVTIRGTPLALARQFQSTVPDPDVEILGDTHTARALQALFAEIDIDWEEHLARLVGDAAAHQIGNAVRDFTAYGRRVFDTLFQNTSEYVQHEARVLPPSGAMMAFVAAVDTLRDDTDRLEARIRRLQQAVTAAD